MSDTIRLAACLTLLSLCTASAAITVHADFEGGSIGAVRQPESGHLICALKGEVDQDKRNRQASWYYFRVDGAAGHPLTIDLTELPGEYNYRPSIAITGDARPAISYDRRTWTALPDSAVEWDKAAQVLRLELTPTASPVWIAHVPPYTNRDLEALLHESRHNGNLHVATIGKSAKGRPLYLLTVTNHVPPATSKKVLWLMARQHAWESGTSWVMDAAVRYVLSDDPAAVAMRNRVIWKFFPMADPDGVARGGVRFNVYGYDVNRNWDIADLKTMPEIASLRKAVFDWVDGGHHVDLFVSLHNTNNDYFQGPLTAAGPEVRQSIERLNERMRNETRLDLKVARDLPLENIDKGRMDAPQALFHYRKITALLLETNIQKNPRVGRPLGLTDFREIGAELVRAMANFAP